MSRSTTDDLVTAELERVIDLWEQVRGGDRAALLNLRPGQLWSAGRALTRMPAVVCRVGNDPAGVWIASSFGRSRIRLTIELPHDFDAFIRRHDRANNLRKSIRRSAAAGIQCRRVADEAEQADLLQRLIATRKGTGDCDHVADLAAALGLRPGFGEHLVATDQSGEPLAIAILLQSQTTAQLAFLCSNLSAGSTTVARYALNAFAVQRSIETGSAVLLGSGYLGVGRDLRVFARNTGYRPRRIMVRRC